LRVTAQQGAGKNERNFRPGSARKRRLSSPDDRATNDDQENFAPGVLDQAFQECGQEFDEDSGVDAASSLIMNRIPPRGESVGLRAVNKNANTPMDGLINAAGPLNMTSAIPPAVRGQTRPRGINLLVRFSRQDRAIGGRVP
jgi:hypothetical protein